MKYPSLAKLFLALMFSCQPLAANAQDLTPLLQDLNGDGVVSYLAFGDSITFGIGDTAPQAGGYPRRLRELLNIPVDNEGVPGEELLTAGVYRFPDVVRSNSDDITGIMEGTNDAVRRAETGTVSIALQKLINVANVLGRKTILMTYPTPCCDHESLAPFTSSYSQAVINLATVNDIRIADLRRAWQTSCVNSSECELYNLPEGLHPNELGYDVIAQTIAASLLGVDIFAPDGAQKLESALGLPEGTVVVKPSAADAIN